MKPKCACLCAFCGVPFVMVLSNSMLIPVLPLMQCKCCSFQMVGYCSFDTGWFDHPLPDTFDDLDAKLDRTCPEHLWLEVCWL